MNGPDLIGFSLNSIALIVNKVHVYLYNTLQMYQKTENYKTVHFTLHVSGNNIEAVIGGVFEFT